MKYASDVESNRLAVANNLKNVYDEGYFSETEKKVQDIYPLLLTNVTRKDLVPYILDNKDYLTAWKSVVSADRWLKLIVDMQIAKVPGRDITIIKQIIEQEFLVLLEDIRQDLGSEEITLQPGQLLIIKNVVSSEQKRGVTGITVIIKG